MKATPITAQTGQIPKFRIIEGREYVDAAGRIWTILRTLPGGRADLTRSKGAIFSTMRYIDIHANKTPVESQS